MPKTSVLMRKVTKLTVNSIMGILAWVPLALLLLGGSRGDLVSSQVVAEVIIDPIGGRIETCNKDDSCDQNRKKNLLDLANAQIDWILSEGGRFDRTKIVIQPVDANANAEGDSDIVEEGNSEGFPYTTNDNLGIFAADDILEGDRLIEIPVSAVLSSESDSDRCDATLTLISEVKKGTNSSNFAPYLDYLYSKEGSPSIPSTWSSTGKNLLQTIHGPNLHPKNLVDISFFDNCVDEEDDEIGIEEGKTWQQFEFAYATTLARSWDEYLIPLIDMINHNGNFNVAAKSNLEGWEESEDPDVISIHATRDIRKGEQLYSNYRFRDRKTEHHVSKMLRNYGFVEDYPQRWVIPTPARRSNVEENVVPDQISFDIIRIENGDDVQYELKWVDPKQPLVFGFVAEHLQKELTRIAEIKPFVITTAGTLTSENERNTTLKYYQSLTVAYKTVIATIEEAIDTLPAPVENPGDEFMACDDFEDLYDEINGWKFVSGTTSSHQQVDYYYNEEKKDACLFLEDYLHACLSNRPHYHEVFVHYPAHFLEKVERVLFIGGGDSMVLHEVLKYDQLELVVGLELDQHVVRSTFAQMGTQPHFHNDKVEWWFGDAAVALNALQTEYYGTFDLVVVDILSEVAESLQVTKNVTIMEAAMMLMKPNGIIVKNEDEGYVPGSTNSTTFTEYTTDVVYYDVPVYCLQTFVMGSNTVDFSKAEPTDHKVSNFYIKGVDEFQSQFDTWYTSGTVAKGEEDAKVENNDDSSSEEESTVSPSIIGVVMIIEAEEISITLDSPSDVMEIINETLRAIGFTVIKSYDRELLDGYTLISLLEEGCITARCFTDEEYCAMDVQLWKSAHRVELVKKEMLLALESEESSVYRIVTTGIYGLEENNSNPKIGPPPKKTAFRQRSVPKDDENTQPKIQTTFKKREDPTIDFKNATTDDYDSTSALAQWESQEPFGFQGLTKFNLPFEYDKKRLTYMLVDVLTKALSMLLKEWENQDKDQIIVEPYDVGDGLVVVATWSEGNILFVWDGADRVDMTIFSLEDSGVLSLKLVREYFRKYLEPIEKDEFPRGTGRVINHRNVFGLEDEDEDEDEEEDEERSHPFWAP
mmetsp:Transcript_14994/g.30658  ORF Transcript_14994/g.30658 Transcript_14994/m.30658 type:complete len:1097 (-) Transcript_14994:155-3445(-)